MAINMHPYAQAYSQNLTVTLFPLPTRSYCDLLAINYLAIRRNTTRDTYRASSSKHKFNDSLWNSLDDIDTWAHERLQGRLSGHFTSSRADLFCHFLQLPKLALRNHFNAGVACN